MNRTFSRDRFTWLAYLMLALYGYFLNIFGPITPFLKDELKLSYTISSLHFTAFAVGILLVGLGGHWVVQHFGRWRSLWIGAIGISLGALLLVAGRNPAMTIGAAFLMGLVGSLILAIVPAALSDQHNEMRTIALTEANVIASLIVTTAPLIVGWSARLIVGWRFALVLAAFMPILLYLGFGKGSSPVAEAKNDLAETRKPLPSLFWVYWAAIFMAVSVEFCMIYWSADYLEHIFGMEKASAAQSVSWFLAAMILGRVAGSQLVRRFSTSGVVTASILIAGLGFSLFWKAGNVTLGLTGLFLTGLGVASLYPLILALAIGVARDNTVRASARATLASGTAILVLPLVLGRLADKFGIGPAYGMVAMLLLSVFVIIHFAGRISPVRSTAVS